MSNQIIFEELEKDEKIILLRVFDYDVDDKGFILNNLGARISSEEIPSMFLHIDSVSMVPGSLKLIEGTPTAISKFIRERAKNVKPS